MEQTLHKKKCAICSVKEYESDLILLVKLSERITCSECSFVGNELQFAYFNIKDMGSPLCLKCFIAKAPKGEH